MRDKWYGNVMAGDVEVRLELPRGLRTGAAGRCGLPSLARVGRSGFPASRSLAAGTAAEATGSGGGSTRSLAFAWGAKRPWYRRPRTRGGGTSVATSEQFVGREKEEERPGARSFHAVDEPAVLPLREPLESEGGRPEHVTGQPLSAFAIVLVDPDPGVEGEALKEGAAADVGERVGIPEAPVQLRGLERGQRIVLELFVVGSDGLGRPPGDAPEDGLHVLILRRGQRYEASGPFSSSSSSKIPSGVKLWKWTLRLTAPPARWTAVTRTRYPWRAPPCSRATSRRVPASASISSSPEMVWDAFTREEIEPIGGGREDAASCRPGVEETRVALVELPHFAPRPPSGPSRRGRGGRR
jgi:hypothetical protein